MIVRFNGLRGWLAALLLAAPACQVLVGAVVQQSQAAPAPQEKKAPEEAKPQPVIPPELPPGAAAPVDPKTYKIGPEDVLMIRIWREPELTGPVVVRPDGFVTLPLVGDMKVQEITPEELGNKLKEEYAKFINNPVVMVSLQTVGSKKYYINGNVYRTGMFPLVVPTTVLEAISRAGGFTEFANKKKVIILRGGQRLYFNYKDVIKGKNLQQNVQLENGDFIIVE